MTTGLNSFTRYHSKTFRVSRKFRFENDEFWSYVPYSDWPKILNGVIFFVLLWNSKFFLKCYQLIFSTKPQSELFKLKKRFRLNNHEIWSNALKTVIPMIPNFVADFHSAWFSNCTFSLTAGLFSWGLCQKVHILWKRIQFKNHIFPSLALNSDSLKFPKFNIDIDSSWVLSTRSSPKTQQVWRRFGFWNHQLWS